MVHSIDTSQALVVVALSGILNRDALDSALQELQQDERLRAVRAQLIDLRQVTRDDLTWEDLRHWATSLRAWLVGHPRATEFRSAIVAENPAHYGRARTVEALLDGGHTMASFRTMADAAAWLGIAWPDVDADAKP